MHDARRQHDVRVVLQGVGQHGERGLHGLAAHLRTYEPTNLRTYELTNLRTHEPPNPHDPVCQVLAALAYYATIDIHSIRIIVSIRRNPVCSIESPPVSSPCVSQLPCR